jgi:hypothetical protein
VKGVIGSYAVYQNGVFSIRIECRDEMSYHLVKKKLRLVGIFITVEKGKGFIKVSEKTHSL